MKVEQFVMAYQVEQDRIRAMLPPMFESLRPVMRINTEIYDGQELYMEFNTPVEGYGKKGWLNIAYWNSARDPIGFVKEGDTTRIEAPFFELEYVLTGGTGGCPAEKDNDCTFFLNRASVSTRESEKITSDKSFCDCSFKWKFNEGDAQGQSLGKTLPAYPEEQSHIYEPQRLHAMNAAAIECKQVLGSYVVEFNR